MTYKILALPPFDKQVKRLAKKYPSFKKDFQNIIEELKTNPETGTFIGNNCYKIRFAISSKGRGKSGGARLITHFILNEDNIYLIAVYDKSDKANMTDKELKELLNLIP